MNNNIQCSIESSTTKIELNSAVDGVFLVPELEGLVGLPEIRTTSGVNAGYDGGWTSAQNYDARLISIRGVIANPDISKVEDKRRAIASLLGQGRKEQLTLRFTTEAGNAYAISVRTISCEMALQRVLTTQEFLIQLRADDPLIYDDGTTGGIAAILQPQRALGGFEINFGLPLAIGGGAEDTVVDNGNETVYPVIKLYGALHSPTVVNRTTNQQMQILADLQYSIDWHTYRSATGDYILVSDGLNGAPMTLSQLTGNAEQTTYSGKNLIPLETADLTNSGARYQNFKIGLPAGTYTISYDITNISLGSNQSISVYMALIGAGGSGTNVDIDISGTITSTTSTHKTYTFTTTAASDISSNSNIRLTQTSWDNGARCKLSNIQIEAGSTPTSFEPYVGGIPAPNPQFPMPVSTVTGEQTVKVEGKNLFDMDDFLTTAGATYTKDGGQYSITAWGNLISIRYPLQSVKTGNTYTISLDGVAQSTTSTRLQVYKNGSVIGTIYGGTDHQEHSYTFTADGSQYELNATYSSPFSSPVIFKNPQLELGSATTYEPYQGQSYEVNLGKNLFSVAFDSGGSTPASDTNAFTLTKPSTRAKMFNFPTTLAAGTYTISFNITSDTTSQSSVTGGIRCQLLSSSGAMISGTTAVAIGTGAKSKTWTVSEPVRAIYFYINGSEADDVSVAMTNVMLERGSTPTSYAPYFTPIELCKIGTYQDRIYKDSGKWYIEKQVGKVVLDGREAGWGIFSNNNAFYSGAYDTQKPSSTATAGAIMANYYTAESEVNIYNARVDYGIGISSQDRFLIRNKDIATVANLKTWLSTHPTTVYYPLATPTTTEITDETLLSQLNFLASLYKGENNISIVGTGAQGEMTVRYATDYTVNQDIITIDSQARTITLNGQDVYHLKTSESEFLVLAPGENKLYLTSEVSDDSGYAEVKFKQGYLSI